MMLSVPGKLFSFALFLEIDQAPPTSNTCKMIMQLGSDWKSHLTVAPVF